MAPLTLQFKRDPGWAALVAVEKLLCFISIFYFLFADSLGKYESLINT